MDVLDGEVTMEEMTIGIRGLLFSDRNDLEQASKIGPITIALILIIEGIKGKNIPNNRDLTIAPSVTGGRFPIRRIAVRYTIGQIGIVTHRDRHEAS